MAAVRSSKRSLGDVGKECSVAHSKLRSQHRHIQLHSSRFLWAASTHLLLPLSYITLRLQGMKGLVRTYQLNSGNIHVLLYHVLFPLCIWGNLLVWALFAVTDGPPAERWTTSLREVLTPVILYFFHRLMIGLKYAYLPEDALDEGCGSDLSLSPQRVREEELSAWNVLSPTVVQRELGYVSDRFGVCLQRTAFMLSGKQVRELAHSAGVEEAMATASAAFDVTYDEDELPLVSLLLLFLQRLKKPPPMALVGRVCVLIHVFIPVFFFARNHAVNAGLPIDTPPFAQPGLDTLVRVLTMLNDFVWLGVLYRFLGIIVVDYQRRAKLLSMLAGACTPQGDTEDDREDLPQFVRLDCPHNVATWMTARRLIVGMGRRISLRMNLYTSAAFALTVGLFLWIIVQQLLSGSSGLDLPTTGFIVQLGWDMLCLMGYLAVMVQFGYAANRQVTTHRELIVMELIGIRDRLRSEMEPDVYTRLQDASLMLDSTLKFLEVEDELRPIRLLGFRASPTIVKTLVAGGAGSVISLLRIIS